MFKHKEMFFTKEERDSYVKNKEKHYHPFSFGYVEGKDKKKTADYYIENFKEHIIMEGSKYEDYFKIYYFDKRAIIEKNVPLIYIEEYLYSQKQLYKDRFLSKIEGLKPVNTIEFDSPEFCSYMNSRFVQKRSNNIFFERIDLDYDAWHLTEVIFKNAVLAYRLLAEFAENIPDEKLTNNKIVSAYEILNAKRSS